VGANRAKQGFARLILGIVEELGRRASG
jgi:hypothetical protein